MATNRNYVRIYGNKRFSTAFGMTPGLAYSFPSYAYYYSIAYPLFRDFSDVLLYNKSVHVAVHPKY